MGKTENRSGYQNRKTGDFECKNRKTDLKSDQNRKTEKPNVPLLYQGLKDLKLRICGFDHYTRAVSRF